MTAMKAQGLEAYLRRPDPAIAVVLIYGEEAEAVRDLAGRAVTRIAGSLDDPFSVVKLDEHDLASDPARLVDEVQSMSMLGGNRAVWVKGAGEAFLKALAPILDGTVSGNVIVAEAGVLSNKSGLRPALEKSTRAIIVPLYEAEDGDIAAALDQALGRSGLKIEQSAKFRFAELVGSSRALLQREVEKLSAYCLGQQQVSLADVESVCGNGAEFDPDDLVDAVFSGDLAATDRRFQALVQSGSDAGRLLIAAHGHALRLQDFKMAIEKGGRAEMLLKQARPPVFFKRHETIRSQLSVWNFTALLAAASTLAGAILQTRQNAALAEAIASRVLISVARNARALQAGLN